MSNFTEKSIPSSLHACGLEGVANAVTFMALMDIARETKLKLTRGEDPDMPPHTHEYLSAVCYLKRKHNFLYTLEIPGEEMLKKVKEEAINDWKRKHR